MHETAKGRPCELACAPGAGHVRRVAVEAPPRLYGDATLTPGAGAGAVGGVGARPLGRGAPHTGPHVPAAVAGGAGAAAAAAGGTVARPARVVPSLGARVAPGHGAAVARRTAGPP